MGFKLKEYSLTRFFEADLSFIGYTGFTQEHLFATSVRWRLRLFSVRTEYFYRLFFSDAIFIPTYEHKIKLDLGVYDFVTKIRDKDVDFYLNVDIK